MRIPILLLVIALPLRHLLVVTSSYGDRVHPVTGSYQFHAGVDLRADDDTVYAVMNGRIDKVGYDRYLGIFMKLSNGPFCITYGHLSQCLTDADSVSAGSAIAVSGATGRTTGPHLHFAVQFHGRYIDPLQFLAKGFQTNH